MSADVLCADCSRSTILSIEFRPIINEICFS
jgi:hypothetical protein